MVICLDVKHVQDEAALDETPTAHQLLRTIQNISPLLSRCAAQADADGCLAPEVASALKSGGFWRMRLCAELGGLELPIVTQIEILAALAAEDAASAWCSMVANRGTAVIGATMPQAAIERIFVKGVPACIIVTATGGSATPADDGFLLNGTWRMASAIHQADWVHGTAFIERDPSRLLPFVIPARDAQLLNSWNPAGLAGTGSDDFTLNNYFLPSELAGHEAGPFRQVRGKRRYDDIGVELIDSYENLAFAIGVSRRALRELRSIIGRPGHEADRELTQAQFARAFFRLQAVEALAISFYIRIDEASLGQPQSWLNGERYLPRMLAAHASALALECVHFAFRKSGLAALRRPNIFEKLLRDMSVAANHAVVDDFAGTSYGQHLIESGLVFEPWRRES